MDFVLKPLHLFTNPTTSTIFFLQAIFLFGASAHKRMENLWFDRKRFENWLVNTDYVKKKGVGKLD